MTDELPRAVFPGIAQREFAAGFAGNPQRLHAGGAKILVQDADRIIGDDVLRTGHRKRCDGNAAGERFELHDAERVGETREYEDVRRGEMRRENSVVQLAEEFRAWIAAFQLRYLGTGADDDFGAGQV